MKKLNCCDTGCTKDVQITIDNIGSEAKTFRLFNYGNELPSVDDNTEIGEYEAGTNTAITASNYLSTYVSSVSKLFLGGQSNFKIIDTTTNTVLATLPIVSYFAPFYNGGNTIYAIASLTNEVYCIDINTNSISNTISLGAFGTPNGIVGDSDGYIYVMCPSANAGTGAIVKINSSGTIVADVDLSFSNNILIALLGNNIYHMNNVGDIVGVVNKNTMLQFTLNFLPNSSSVRDIKVFNNLVYVLGTNTSNKATVWAFDDTFNTVEIDLNVNVSSGGYMNVNDDPNGIYILCPTAQGIAKVNTQDNTFTIINSSRAYWMAEYGIGIDNYFGSSDTFVSPTNKGRVDIFDSATDELLQTVTNSTFDATRWITFDEDTLTLYAVNIGNSTPIASSEIVPVTITVNGGETSLEQLNSETSNNPIGMCQLKISTSQLSVFQNPLQKILWSSAGQQVNYPIVLGSYVTAYNTPEVSTITIPGKDLQQNNLLNGTNYIQGVIPANSYMSFVISYCQFTASNIVGGNNVYCGDNWNQVPSPIRKKRYSRASFKFIKGNN